MTQKISRRVFTKSVIAGAATLSFSQPLLAQTIIEDEKLGEGVVRNISSFKAQNWFEHFEHLEDGAILCDTTSRAIHFLSLIHI